MLTSYHNSIVNCQLSIVSYQFNARSPACMNLPSHEGKQLAGLLTLS